MPEQPKSQTLHQLGQYLADRFFEGERPELTPELPEQPAETETEEAVG